MSKADQHARLRKAIERLDELDAEVDGLKSRVGRMAPPEKWWGDALLLTEVQTFSVSNSTTTEELFAMLAVAKKDKKRAAQILSVTYAIMCHCL